MRRASITLIRPTRGWIPLNLRELWEFRGLLGVFVLRDVRVKYKQTLLGVTWAVLQPLTMMLVFSVFFGAIARVPFEGPSYALFALTGLVPWTYLSTALGGASQSVVDNRPLITKVYFPRLILPLAPVLSSLLDLGITVLLLAGLVLWNGIPLTAAALWLPAFVLLLMMSAWSVSLWFSALNGLYRDFRYIVAFLLQVWLFASPVVYPSALVPEKWRAVYGLNPMVGVIEGFRWALLGSGAPPNELLAVAAAVVLVTLAGGLAFFRRAERILVDVL